MYSINELSLREHVDQPRLTTFLADVLSVEKVKIGSHIDFWKSIGTPAELSIGLVVKFSASGFKTFATWHQKADMAPLELLKIAERASKHFMTEVAVGDCLGSPGASTDRFLVVTPESQLYRAYAISNSDVFEVVREGPSMPLADALETVARTGDLGE